MDIAERTDAEIRQRLERLRAQYGSFDVHETTVENDPDFFEQGKAMAAEGWIGDAGAWVTDEAGRVVLIRHEDTPDRWGIPGGGHEPGETMTETARREVREETGIECRLTGVAYARRKTIVLASDPDQRYAMLTVVFSAEYEHGTIEISDEEVLEARWFADLPAHVSDFVAERVSPWDVS